MFYSRRRFLFALIAAPAWAALQPAKVRHKKPISTEAFLDRGLIRPAALYFAEQADPHTGIVKDRAYNTGYDKRTIGSIAATGFGLTGLCIAAHRGLLPVELCREQVRRTLDFFARVAVQEHGFFYHFIDIANGARLWACEISSIDTALLLCGVLTAKQEFADDAEINRLATSIYERVDWPWMLNGGVTVSFGWKPESGFLPGRWDHYCELMMIYLLGMGSPTHPLPQETWGAWSRPIMEYAGLEFIGAPDPLFVHQYSHAWFDFRDKHDGIANYFVNSITATEAHRRFCIAEHGKFRDYDLNLWGITASDSQKGYRVWGGPPAIGPIDGTIVPCASAGSLPFLPKRCLAVLQTIARRYPKAVGRYGFVDAFNPLTGWFDSDVLGIDLGISMLMAENYQSGYVWNVFMRNPEVVRGMELAGFVSDRPGLL